MDGKSAFIKQFKIQVTVFYFSLLLMPFSWDFHPLVKKLAEKSFCVNMLTEESLYTDA